MVIDLQFGSTGKGLLAGYLAKRKPYDTVVCAFAPNAGHTYIDKVRDLKVMTQQLPTGITCPTVKNVLLGPGSLIDLETLFDEMSKYDHWIGDKRIMIHPHAAIVTKEHRDREARDSYSNIGSTTKGVGESMIHRIRRIPLSGAVAKNWSDRLGSLLVTPEEYRNAIESSSALLVEGAQGFSLSMYHGWYPYTTSRDVTPWQIAADCGLPFKAASYINICGTLRTYPIRVNNRTGTSGPGYPDQREMQWSELEGVEPELTTVTKLPRRIFTFSELQLREALWHCSQYWKTELFLNFANYHGPDKSKTEELIKMIETPMPGGFNAPRVEWIGYGPDDSEVVARDIFDAWPESEGGEL